MKIHLISFIISISLLIHQLLSFANEENDSTKVFADAKATLVDAIPDAFSFAYITQGMMSGADWIGLTKRQKRIYLLAYQDGMTANAIFYIKDKKLREYFVSSFPNGDIQDMINDLDKIYADKANIIIPIPYALIAVRNKFIGVEQKKIDAYIEYLRNDFLSMKKNTK